MRVKILLASLKSSASFAFLDFPSLIPTWYVFSPFSPRLFAYRCPLKICQSNTHSLNVLFKLALRFCLSRAVFQNKRWHCSVCSLLRASLGMTWFYWLFVESLTANAWESLVLVQPPQNITLTPSITDTGYFMLQIKSGNCKILSKPMLETREERSIKEERDVKDSKSSTTQVSTTHLLQAPPLKACHTPGKKEVSYGLFNLIYTV